MKCHQYAWYGFWQRTRQYAWKELPYSSNDDWNEQNRSGLSTNGDGILHMEAKTLDGDAHLASQNECYKCSLCKKQN